MTEILSPDGYEQTKEKLAELECRLARQLRTSIPNHQHQIEVQRSYEQMIRQYRREIKLYEASHSENVLG